MSAADEFLEELAARVAELVLDGLRAGAAPNMVDQHASLLGPRRHAAAVRRRVAAGVPGAAIVGRRLLLSREAIDEELPARARKLADPDGALLAAELGLKVVRSRK